MSWRSLAAVMASVALAAVLLAALVGGSASAQGDEPAASGSPERGRVLYQASCATCHGADGAGVEEWPGIQDAGAAGIDFQLRTGRMPFQQGPGEQAQPKPPAYDEQEIRDLVAYAASLGEGPEIPEVKLDDALLPRGQELFAASCAACHGASGNGGAVGGGALAWPITDDAPLTVAEAMVSGPGQMPVFDLPEEDLNAIVTYVEYLGEAANPGGLAIGGIGPVPEGLVAWGGGMALLALIVYLVGRQWDRKGDRP